MENEAQVMNIEGVAVVQEGAGKRNAKDAVASLLLFKKARTSELSEACAGDVSDNLSVANLATSKKKDDVIEIGDNHSTFAPSTGGGQHESLSTSDWGFTRGGFAFSLASVSSSRVATIA